MKKIGVVLLNIGTPKEPTYGEVRAYLNQFLMDPRVINLPLIFRYPLVKFLITPLRAWASAKKYSEIWLKNGSPLLVTSEAQTKILNELLPRATVVLGMRYGEPNIRRAIAGLIEDEVDELLLVPLFPQYSSAATGSVVDEALAFLRTLHHVPTVKTLSPFFADDFFIDAQARLMREHLSPHDHLIFSFHGLPTEHVARAHKDKRCNYDNDCPEANVPKYCYRAQCFATSTNLARKLDLPRDRYTVCFQSRLGTTEWIQPYLLATLKKLREKNITDIAIVAPSFVSDCLETLHEIGIEARAFWHGIGGKKLKLLPCVNDDREWLSGLAEKIIKSSGSE